MKYCKKCGEWIGDAEFPDHMKQENIGMNTDAVDRKQYTGGTSEQEDYMICILHQKKTPCPVKGCKYRPLGRIRKSYMLSCAKGIIREWMGSPDADYSSYINYIEKIPTSKGTKYRISTYPFFPFNGELVPIDMKTRTVILLGMTVHLKL